MTAQLGRTDLVSVPEARDKACHLITGFFDMPAKTKGPRTPGRAMTAFADEFIDRHAHHRKPRTLEANRRAIEKCILPAFAHMTVDEITVEHARDWFASMAKRPGIANPLQEHVALPDAAEGAVPDGRRDGPAQRHADGIASLEWDWIKDKRIFLSDSKSWPRTVIDSIPRYGPDCPFLFPGQPLTRRTGTNPARRTERSIYSS